MQNKHPTTHASEPNQDQSIQLDIIAVKLGARQLPPDGKELLMPTLIKVSTKPI